MAVITWAVDSTKEASYTDAEAREVFSGLVGAASQTSIYSGVRPGGANSTGLQVTAAGTPNNTVIVDTGVLHSASGTGAYITMNDASLTLTVPAADATLLRRDAVMVDPAAATAANRIIYVTGTPGGGSYPSPSGAQYKIANVDCRSIATAGSTIIRTADIFDQRAYTASMGGRILCTSSTRPATPHKGLEIFETDTSNILTWDGTVWRNSALTRMVTSTTRPSSPANGTTIFETDTGIVRIWRSDQSKWNAVGGDMPIAFFSRSTDATLSGGSWVIISWDATVVEDPGGTFTFVTAGNNQRIKIPISGYYKIEMGSEWSGFNDSNRELQLRKNSGGSDTGGTAVFANNVNASPAGNPTHAVSKTVSLLTTDYLEGFVKHNSGSSQTYLHGPNTYLSITFVRDQ